jgi:hypothetical protein
MDEELVIFDIDGTLADISERVHHIFCRRGPQLRGGDVRSEGLTCLRCAPGKF